MDIDKKLSPDLSEVDYPAFLNNKDALQKPNLTGMLFSKDVLVSCYKEATGPNGLNFDYIMKILAAGRTKLVDLPSDWNICPIDINISKQYFQLLFIKQNFVYIYNTITTELHDIVELNSGNKDKIKDKNFIFAYSWYKNSLFYAFGDKLIMTNYDVHKYKNGVNCNMKTKDGVLVDPQPITDIIQFKNRYILVSSKKRILKYNTSRNFISKVLNISFLGGIEIKHMYDVSRLKGKEESESPLILFVSTKGTVKIFDFVTSELFRDISIDEFKEKAPLKMKYMICSDTGYIFFMLRTKGKIIILHVNLKEKKVKYVDTLKFDRRTIRDSSFVRCESDDIYFVGVMKAEKHLVKYNLSSHVDKDVSNARRKKRDSFMSHNKVYKPDTAEKSVKKESSEQIQRADEIKGKSVIKQAFDEYSNENRVSKTQRSDYTTKKEIPYNEAINTENTKRSSNKDEISTNTVIEETKAITNTVSNKETPDNHIFIGNVIEEPFSMINYNNEESDEDSKNIYLPRYKRITKLKDYKSSPIKKRDFELTKEKLTKDIETDLFNQIDTTRGEDSNNINEEMKKADTQLKASISKVRNEIKKIRELTSKNFHSKRLKKSQVETEHKRVSEIKAYVKNFLDELCDN